ncbi:hypothetical protein HAP47_0026485 [Bradyrhizobium sp. 41S5]|uniref:hypothetical protein n=1 Tax=Bradyrhizobium sp. 41S5 TaxID=1404443 RepID=UPI00156A84D5|nr:hypothetical protein [Bradyrhizobium sp. 41S5]UFX42765.1 hypothetical protein HAP47_0026485 [Bradyrhizobium sp. 41S5]
MPADREHRTAISGRVGYNDDQEQMSRNSDDGASACVRRDRSIADASKKKPNTVMIMADDVGIWNISAFHRGMMGGNRSASWGVRAWFR